MAKRKQKIKPPRRTRLKKPQRLQAAKSWIPSYTGKNLVHGYRNWFNVSLLCAALELKQLGVAVDDGYIAQLRQTEVSLGEARRKKREARKKTERVEQYPDSDGTFAYIAGYTSWGFPYGVTWEEMGEKPPWQRDEDGDDAGTDELPPGEADEFADFEDPFAADDDKSYHDVTDPFAELSEP